MWKLKHDRGWQNPGKHPTLNSQENFRNIVHKCVAVSVSFSITHNAAAQSPKVKKQSYMHKVETCKHSIGHKDKDDDQKISWIASISDAEA